MADRAVTLAEEARYIINLFPPDHRGQLERVVESLDRVWDIAQRAAAPEMTENQIRHSESSLMVGRLNGLARQSDLSASERIGASRAQLILENRVTELKTRGTN